MYLLAAARGRFGNVDAMSGHDKVDVRKGTLSACKEFDLACGYPANPNDIEMCMEQGFSVFVMNWSKSGFETIDMGRRAAGR